MSYSLNFYIIPCKTPFEEFRLELISGPSENSAGLGDVAEKSLPASPWRFQYLGFKV